jgi:phage-related minor tail protein
VAIKEVVKRVNKARKSVTRAEVMVTAAEDKVLKRQNLIQETMKALNEREKELLQTTATMEVLGIGAETSLVTHHCNTITVTV